MLHLLTYLKDASSDYSAETTHVRTCAASSMFPLALQAYAPSTNFQKNADKIIESIMSMRVG